MKEYRYVKIYIGKFISSELNEHREIIDEKAAQGYRYAGYLPTTIDSSGRILSLDLIFERDTDGETE
ncbi:MAG: DUF4177 domain-containing protein [Solobacterium sp.]|nr:DUF4177 domain-containing protein [Solobacterium sp.]